MHVKINKLIVILLVFVMVVSLATTAFAVEARYSNIKRIAANISFSGTTASCSVRIFGDESVTSITDVNITLSDSRGNTIESWSNLSSTGQNFTFFDTVTNLTKGETYTLSFSASVNVGGNSEPISGSSTNTCPR